MSSSERRVGVYKKRVLARAAEGEPERGQHEIDEQESECCGRAIRGLYELSAQDGTGSGASRRGSVVRTVYDPRRRRLVGAKDGALYKVRQVRQLLCVSPPTRGGPAAGAERRPALRRQRQRYADRD